MYARAYMIFPQSRMKNTVEEEKARIEQEIKTMPNYFAPYETIVHFIGEEELNEKHHETKFPIVYTSADSVFLRAESGRRHCRRFCPASCRCADANRSGG